MSKNRLQEFCQRNRLNLPIYTFESEGSAHEPKWSCECCVRMDSNGSGYKYRTQEVYKTKTEASHKAAEIMLDRLSKDSHDNETVAMFKEEINSSTKISSNSVKPTILKSIQLQKTIKIYLIDLENKPMNDQRFMQHNDRIIIGFIDSDHHSYENYSNWSLAQTADLVQEVSKSNLVLYDIKGGYPDLADHLLTSFTGPIIDFIKRSKYVVRNVYVVTGDKFGFAAALCINNMARLNGIDVMAERIVRLS